ncbi:Propeptide, PepSY amd peptidase M4 [Rhodopseudomonas palustris BisB5]|uniref:Propeptide, PepSY amd peptidase M4 n=1 Tax=Rhodopseudomonas palustris (strain BisB5) TaxID=316057 RepID=Q12ZW8_RHOPS|nr:Propeptide, PepSY amd peptidase M4 [Rhodopseudomonas palustris BisB5]
METLTPIRWLVLGLALAGAAMPAIAVPAFAHEHDRHHRGGHGHAEGREHRHASHDEVRRAVERGEIRPLAELLTMIRDKLPGEITSVEIERDDGRWIYEFHVVDKRGRLFEVYVDPLSGDIRETREK